MTDIPADIAHDIERATASQDSLYEWLTSIEPVDPTTPSLLPGWTVGHVLAHIARAADSYINVFHGTPQFPGGIEQRNADIAEGAVRPWAEQLDDIAAASARLLAAFAEVADWSGAGPGPMGNPRPFKGIPEHRVLEVEVHRADLGLGYTFADMPAEFVEHDLAQYTAVWVAKQEGGATELPAEVLVLPAHEQLAWLLGRLAVDGVPPAAIFR